MATLRETCERYRLDGALIERLAARGVFSADAFGDEDACRAAVACFLHEAGLAEDALAAYFLTQDGGRTQRILLRRLRARALERSHEEQRRVDKIDCLLRKLDEGCGGMPCPKK